MSGERRDDEIRRGKIHRQRDVMDVADPEQRADIRIVRLRRPRIHEEEHHVDVTRGDAGRDLRVAPSGPLNSSSTSSPSLSRTSRAVCRVATKSNWARVSRLNVAQAIKSTFLLS